MKSAPILQLKGLTKRFGRVAALRRLDLEIHAGEFVALFGPNGAGKSTLLKVAATLLGPDEGKSVFQGGAPMRSAIGYVSHQSLLYGNLSGLENLLFYARLYGLPDPPAQARSMLDRMGLKQAGGQLVRGYSRGMKQRLTLARALLHDPVLLLLDEPYTGLDQHGGRLLTETLSLLKSQGRTVFLVTHNAREGLQLCSRVLIQNAGRIVFDAPREEVSDDDFESIYFQKIEETRPRRKSRGKRAARAGG
ncbi:MAG TPA: ABC transporter ATP-binding protein [Acidobacteriota bacterium]|nr:ABC transporter ATP-binding protein [Acidobacteriota bacterium]